MEKGGSFFKRLLGMKLKTHLNQKPHEGDELITQSELEPEIKSLSFEGTIQ